MAAKFEAALKAAIEDGTASGAAAIAVDKTGKVIYSNALGHRDIEKKANDFSLDTTAWMASMTKVRFDGQPQRPHPCLRQLPN